jgi:hypothetical protein
LEPAVIAELIRRAVEGVRDEEVWAEAKQLEEEHRLQLRQASRSWTHITRRLEDFV